MILIDNIKVIVLDFRFGVLIIEQQYVFNVYVLINKYNKKMKMIYLFICMFIWVRVQYMVFSLFYCKYVEYNVEYILK